MFSGISNIANSVDGAFLFILAISVIMLVGVTVVMIYFAWRYHKSKVTSVEEIEGDMKLEIIWTVIPTILVLAMFWYGYVGFELMRNVPDDAMLIKTTGRMWSWLFEYENGKKSSELVVPEGRPVKLALTSQDVLHSLFIPAFRVKEDAVPGQEMHLWFIAERIGEYDLFCTEYCGQGHSRMITKARVLSEKDFQKWYEDVPAPAASPAAKGKALVQEYGCLGCHTMDGSVLVGPSFKDIWGRNVTVETDGAERSLHVDREYIARSLREPEEDVVKGFAPSMPTFSFSDEDIEAIIAYLKGGEESAAQAEVHDGLQVLQSMGCLGCHTTDGTQLAAPSFKGIWGREVSVLREGTEQTVRSDESYIVRSIVNPSSDVVKGYNAIMPAFAPSEEQMGAILEYFKREAPVAAPAAEVTPVVVEKAAAPEAQVDGEALQPLLKEKRCLNCHTIDGTPKVGPSFKEIFGRVETVVGADGAERELSVDEAYLRKSITEPKADVVKGFKPIMPPSKLTDAELDAIIKYLKSMKAPKAEVPQKTEADGEALLPLLKEKRCLNCHTIDGSPKVGPSFKEIFGRVETVVGADGAERELSVDEAYLRKSITEPKADVVKGFKPIMPPSKLTDAELDAIIKYLKSMEAPKAEASHKPEVDAEALMPLLKEKRCLNCHTIDGTRKVGPSFKAIFGRVETVVGADGAERELSVDEAYLRKSITEPKADVVKGFKPIMPTTSLTDAELDAIIKYLMSMKSEEGAALSRGRFIASTWYCDKCHRTDDTVAAAPTFHGLFGRVRTVVSADHRQTKVTADEAYIVRSIRNPLTEVVAGYENSRMMPRFHVPESQMDALVTYIKSL